MKRLRFILALTAAVLMLTGCWNRMELPDKGFVMGVAVDQIRADKVKLTVQLYKPAQKTGGGQGGGKQGPSFINIETDGESVFDAVRNITLHLGRKAQWSHMRVVIIDDKTAGTENLLSMLELFYRDLEPRLTTKVLITKGDAGKYLRTKPLIEQTITQQLNRIEKVGHREAGKVPDVNLLQLAQALKSQVPHTTLPLAIMPKPNQLEVSGMAMIKNGKMIGTLAGKQTEDILMLTNQFKRGVIHIPCRNAGKQENQSNETIEVVKVDMKKKLIPKPDALKVKINVLISGHISELKCTKMEAREDELKFVQHAESTIAKRLMDTVRTTQREKIDLLEIGNKMYRDHTNVWKKWKNDWERRYSEAEFDIQVDVVIKHSLTTVEKPLYAK